MLVRLLYASRAVEPIQNPTVDAILDTSRSNNREHGITGILCYSDDLFVQVLEGCRDKVGDLFANIMRDPRHHQVRLLHYEEIRERRFGAWNMGQVNASKVNPSLLLKYSEKAELSPFDCSGLATLALLDELIATASVVNRCN
jgi:hypothetical protein